MRARKTLNIVDEDLWYLVGIIATDGCLSLDGRHIDVTSKHRDFLEAITNKLDLKNKICIKNRGKDSKEYYRIQISNRNFYEFLLSIGLTPTKSLTLGKLEVPDQWFPDFIRGVIDGDGSIRKWIHPSNKGEQWSLRIYSAAPKFIQWLQVSIEKNFLAKGRIHLSSGRTFVLKFGKLSAKRILDKCYYEGSLSLASKANLAGLCGATDFGWSKSKTLLCAT